MQTGACLSPAARPCRRNGLMLPSLCVCRTGRSLMLVLCYFLLSSFCFLVSACCLLESALCLLLWAHKQAAAEVERSARLTKQTACCASSLRAPQRPIIARRLQARICRACHTDWRASAFWPRAAHFSPAHSLRRAHSSPALPAQPHTRGAWLRDYAN